MVNETEAPQAAETAQRTEDRPVGQEAPAVTEEASSAHPSPEVKRIIDAAFKVLPRHDLTALLAALQAANALCPTSRKFLIAVLSEIETHHA